MESFKTFFSQIHPLPEDIMDKFYNSWREVEFERKHLMTVEGQTEKYTYFVLEGIQRSYYIKDDKEHVIAFTYPPSFSGIPESFITQTPSKYYLECITKSRMLKLSYDKLQELMDEEREIERLFRKATELVLVGFIHRHYELMALTIEERFKTFAERSPHLFGMVPHKYLASYLGMDATNFSKLLGKVKI